MNLKVMIERLKMDLYKEDVRRGPSSGRKVKETGDFLNHWDSLERKYTIHSNPLKTRFRVEAHQRGGNTRGVMRYLIQEIS